ncbi:MAG TPA: DUF1697 domain-containing protein [Streptosporangiaceae bacterium]|nr:DUF1697 domain-containing protein [Streptosporangiaceae bacterium]
MPTHVALLCGINLGGHKRVAMADLREAVASLGHTGVSTYVQSGNVLFSTSETDTAALAAALKEAIARILSVRAGVIVLSRGELAQVVRDNPFPQETNPRAVHAVFLSGDPGPDLLSRVAAAQREAERNGSRDTARVVGRTLFLHTPDGFGRSRLAAALTSTAGRSPAGVTGTARNWATVTKLLALCSA